jgi:hydrogenase maturation protease
MIRPNGRPIIVIGYGSTVRGDDALGQLVAAQVAERAKPGIEAISVTQLVPELAKTIAYAREVIFVDACTTESGCAVAIEQLTHRANGGGGSHAAGPRELLALAKACYHRAPPAWLVTVPAEKFGMDDHISPAAHVNIGSALRAVEQIIENQQTDFIPMGD